jgi:hypothetical protein
MALRVVVVERRTLVGQFVCDGGFGGVGEGEAGEVAGDHHGFRTGQVYKPGPDLHKASQPSEGKEWRLDRIPLPPHQRRI